MGASSGVRSPVARTPSGARELPAAPAARGLGALRDQLDDPAVVALAIASLTLVTFALVRITGGAPNAVMELGYAPVALAAYAFGWRGGLIAGIAVGLALGPLPALAGFDRVEGPAEWLIRATAFGGIGTLIGRMLDRSASEASHARARLAVVVQRERDSLIALATAAESRDMDAGEHLRRLQLSSHRLAERAGLDPRAAATVGWTSMLHDVGKLRVPERILLKPEPLDQEEWTIVRLHPIWSEQALAGGEHLSVAREVARSHHENWDGTGYPDDARGEGDLLASSGSRTPSTR
jgi:hypothetical protein